MPKKLTDLPQDITDTIGQHLTENAKSTLAAVSKTTRGLFQPHRLQMMANKLLLQVMHGEQDKAAKIKTLKICPELLTMKTRATDYSGRTFNCTAYEYAYWAKDTHMCRMLEACMDEPTKAAMLKRIETIERDGLTYEQQGSVKNSKHFDLMLNQDTKGPLLQALQDYVDGYDAWSGANDYHAMHAAWMKVGLAQRDVPVHVINEYCRPDRSFSPRPAFNVNEGELPRATTYYNYNSGSTVSLFPLAGTASSGLGVDFALFGGVAVGGPVGQRGWRAGFDSGLVKQSGGVCRGC